MYSFFFFTKKNGKIKFQKKYGEEIFIILLLFEKKNLEIQSDQMNLISFTKNELLFFPIVNRSLKVTIKIIFCV